MKQKTLVFAPHAALWIHAFPEALVADALAQSNHEIVYVTCGGLFEQFCVPQASLGLTPFSTPEEKRKVCDQCQSNKARLRKGFGFKGYDVDSQVTAEDRQQIEQILSKLTPQNFLDLIIDGVEIGRNATYEFLIVNKKFNLEFNDREWQWYRTVLNAALFSFFAARRIFDQEKPDHIILYNSAYSVNFVWERLAERRGVPCYFLHAGPSFAYRMQTLVIGRGTVMPFCTDMIKNWERFYQIPCVANDIRRATDHFISLMRGSIFGYSAAKSTERVDIRKHFGIQEHQRVLSATLSSYDELFAAVTIRQYPDESGSVFHSQIEWIRETIEFVKNRKDLFFIIRVHPREFPNKRERVKSDYARMLEACFQDLPTNVQVNWPTDQISIYDLANETDVFLNAFSSAGKEMALLGLPVVTYCPELMMSSSRLNLVGQSKEDYFAKINQALKNGWSLENTRIAYRWCVYDFFYSTLDLSDGYFYKEFKEQKKLWERVLARVGRLIVSDFQQRLDLLLRPKTLKMRDLLGRFVSSKAVSISGMPGWSPPQTGSEQDETRALIAELKRLHHVLFAGELHMPVRKGTLREKLESVF